MAVAITSPEKLKPRLFVAEWCDYLGLRQKEVADAIGLTETHFSRIVDNKLKRRPHKATLEAIRDHFCKYDPSIRIQDLWRNPFDSALKAPGDPVDLAIALRDPKLMLNGRAPTDEERRQIIEYVEFLVFKKSKDDEQ